MAVTWVAASAPVGAQSTSIGATTPAGIANDDVLLAAVFAVSSITAPSGWTQVAATTTFTDGVLLGRLELWKKNSVTTADASTSFTWSQADADFISVAYAVTRDTSIIDTTSTAIEDNSTDWSITIPSLSGTGADQMLIAIAAMTDGDNSGSDSRSPTPPSGTTLATGASATEYRVAIAYRTATGSDSISGAFALHNTGSPAFPIGMGAISARLLPSAGTPEITIAVDSPLDSPALVARQTATKIAVDSPLGAVSMLGWADPSGEVVSTPARYALDLITPDGNVRVPMSSWQATRQTDAAQYAQAVVPSPGSLVDTITEATEFRILRVLQLGDGNSVEIVVAQAPIDSVQYARGSTNYSATLSGYSDAAIGATWPAGTARTLTGIRAIFSTATTMRVRCSIDWLLNPGQSAVADGAPFVTSYVNLYCADGDAFMEVGSRESPP